MKTYQDYVKELVIGLTDGGERRLARGVNLVFGLLPNELKTEFKQRIEEEVPKEDRSGMEERMRLLRPRMRDFGIYECLKSLDDRDNNSGKAFQEFFDLFREACLDVSYLPDFHERLMNVKAFFGLDEVSTRVLASLFIINEEEVLNDLILEKSRKDCLMESYSFISSHRPDVINALSSGGLLAKSGILSLYRPFECNLSSQITEYLMGAGTDNLLEKYISTEPGELLPLEYFEHKSKEIAMLQTLLKSPGKVTALFCGSPGTGKTTLAYSLGMDFIYLKHDIENSDDRRMGLFVARRLAAQTGKLLIVDESDEILSRPLQSLLLSKKDHSPSWLNMFLDTEDDCKILFIANNISQMEESSRRRIHYTINFPPLTLKQRRMIWTNIITKHGQEWLLERKEIESWIKKFDLDAGSINDAILRIKQLGTQDMDFLESYLSQKFTFMKGKEVKVDRVKETYCLEALNMSCSPDELITSLKKFEDHKDRMKNYNLLLSGPSGTGKSELVKFLGETLDREVITMSSSDIISKYVGESEANLRRAFDRAQREGAILFLDEIDGLTGPREGAARQYEKSFSTELLVRMEKFEGICIAATNHLEGGIDKAMLRRFTRKISFDYLNDKGKGLLFQKYFPQFSDLEVLRPIKNLTPGDFKNVSNRLSYLEGFGLKEVLNEFRQEVEHKQIRREVGLRI